MPSGKQMLLHLLEKYSQKYQDKENLDNVSEDIRVGLLLHGSTPPDMWFHVETISWLSESDETHGGGTRQGMGVRGKNIFLSDIFESIVDDNYVLEKIESDFPSLNKSELESTMHIIWLLLKSMEFNSVLNEVENNGTLDSRELEKYLKGYRKQLIEFRKNPGEHLGVADEKIKQDFKERLNRIG